MFLQRSAVAVARRSAIRPIVKRTFASSFVRRKFQEQLNHQPCILANPFAVGDAKVAVETNKQMKKFEGEPGWNFNTHVLGSLLIPLARM